MESLSPTQGLGRAASLARSPSHNPTPAPELKAENPQIGPLGSDMDPA